MFSSSVAWGKCWQASLGYAATSSRPQKFNCVVQLGVTVTYNPTSRFRVETVAQRGYADTSDGPPCYWHMGLYFESLLHLPSEAIFSKPLFGWSWSGMWNGLIKTKLVLSWGKNSADSYVLRDNHRLKTELKLRLVKTTRVKLSYGCCQNWFTPAVSLQRIVQTEQGQEAAWPPMTCFYWWSMWGYLRSACKPSVSISRYGFVRVFHWLIKHEWHQHRAEPLQTHHTVHCNDRVQRGAGRKSKSDVFLNHYTASVTLCVTLSLPPSAADCQMSPPTTTTTSLSPPPH